MITTVIVVTLLLSCLVMWGVLCRGLIASLQQYQHSPTKQSNRQFQVIPRHELRLIVMGAVHDLIDEGVIKAPDVITMEGICESDQLRARHNVPTTDEIASIISEWAVHYHVQTSHQDLIVLSILVHDRLASKD